MAEATVLSGERGAKADAYRDIGDRATQDAKAEKRKISESSVRFFLRYFFWRSKKSTSRLSPQMPKKY